MSAIKKLYDVTYTSPGSLLPQKSQTFNVAKYNSLLDLGLSYGLGDYSDIGRVCIEGAVCLALGDELHDKPQCVTPVIQSFKISLNDSGWASPAARASGLRKLGIAQLGSRGVIDDKVLVDTVLLRVWREMLPKAIAECVTVHMPRCGDLLSLAKEIACGKLPKEHQETYELISDDDAKAAGVSLRDKTVINTLFIAINCITDCTVLLKRVLTGDLNLSEDGIAAQIAITTRNLDYASTHSTPGFTSDSYKRQFADILFDGLTEMKSPGCEILTQVMSDFPELFRDEETPTPTETT